MTTLRSAIGPWGLALVLVACALAGCSRARSTVACGPAASREECAQGVTARNEMSGAVSDAAAGETTADAALPRGRHAAVVHHVPAADAGSNVRVDAAPAHDAEADAATSLPDRCKGVLTFADARFEAAIRADVSVPDTGALHAADVAGIDVLFAQSRAITSLDGIECLKHVTVANLYDNKISDLTPLAGLTQLMSISASKNQMANASALAGLQHLTFVDLSTNQIADVSGLAGLVSLKHLDLSHNALTAIDQLKTLSGLQELDVSSNELASIDVVSHLHALVSLSFSSNSVSSLAAVAGLSHLTLLDASYNHVSDLSALAQLTGVTQLYLAKNSVSDVHALSGLTSLVRLSLSLNALADASPLAGLPALTTLALDGNQLTDANVVTGLTSLHTLWLQDNAITSLAPLIANPGLGSGDEIAVQGDPLSDCSQVQTLKGRAAYVNSDCP